MTYGYAHKNTGEAERKSVTAQFNAPRVSDAIAKIRENAFSREIPIADDETLNFLGTLLAAVKPKKILELGGAVGVFALYAAELLKDAQITVVEKDEKFYAEAVQNFSDFGITSRVFPVLGDAGEVIGRLSGGFDFIFLDCAKAQYIKYLPRLKELLKKGGVLAADDVLLFGYVAGEVETPKKRAMLVTHIREYISAAVGDGGLQTTIVNVGNGVAVSVKL